MLFLQGMLLFSKTPLGKPSKKNPFQAILSHFSHKNFQVKMGGYPHTQPFFGDFNDFKNFYKCFDFSGGQKTLFFKKCPIGGLVSEKKYIIFSDPNVTNVTFLFFFLMKASLTSALRSLFLIIIPFYLAYHTFFFGNLAERSEARR